MSRWPGSCQPAAIPTCITGFTLHGLWPTNNDTTYPQDCNSKDLFNAKNITSIHQRLVQAWYDFDGPNSTALWAHEWSKHGTCALNVLPSELDFFTAGVTTTANVNILGALSDAGIVPSKDKSYAYSDFYAALKKKNNVDCMTTCLSKYGKTVIGTVAYCLDSETQKIMQCAAQFLKANPSNCPATIYFPTIDYES